MPIKLRIDDLNLAIQDCVTECLGADNSLACLAGFCTQLRELRGWSEADIWELDVAVRHILASVMSRRVPGEVDDPAAE